MAHEWMAAVRERDEKQMLQSYVPSVSSAVSRSRRVSETGDAVGAGCDAAAGSCEGTIKDGVVALSGAELERDELNRARRELLFCGLLAVRGGRDVWRGWLRPVVG